MAETVWRQCGGAPGETDATMRTRRA